MKQISYWAKQHVWQTRLLIILIYILLNVIGIFTGKLLKEVNIILPQVYFTAFIICTIALGIWYPDKNAKKRLSSSALYVRRKLFDFSLGAVTFLMIIYSGNNWEHLFIKSQSANATNIFNTSKDSAIYNIPVIKNFIASIKAMDVSKLTQREKLRIIKKQIKTIKSDKETSKSDKTLLIILSILVALALLIGLAALSCSIGCAGSEALAIIVALGGTFLIIFFLVRIIKNISNPREKKKIVVEETGSTQ